MSGHVAQAATATGQTASEAMQQGTVAAARTAGSWGRRGLCGGGGGCRGGSNVVGTVGEIT